MRRAIAILLSFALLPFALARSQRGKREKRSIQQFLKANQGA
jgi:hypothetical protein